MVFRFARASAVAERAEVIRHKLLPAQAGLVKPLPAFESSLECVLVGVRRTGAIGRFGPFVVRPARLGQHRVAVVLPTLTWQAYNLRDDDGDGTGDS